MCSPQRGQSTRGMLGCNSSELVKRCAALLAVSAPSMLELMTIPVAGGTSTQRATFRSAMQQCYRCGANVRVYRREMPTTTRRGRDRSSSVSALPPVWSEAQAEAPASPSRHQVHEAHRHPPSCAQGAATSAALQSETSAPPMREDPIQFLTLDGAVPAILPLLVFSPCTPLGRCMDKTCGETRCSSPIGVDAANIRSNRLGRALARFQWVEDCA